MIGLNVPNKKNPIYRLEVTGRVKKRIEFSRSRIQIAGKELSDRKGRPCGGQGSIADEYLVHRGIKKPPVIFIERKVARNGIEPSTKGL
jgi:hypothetical protein